MNTTFAPTATQDRALQPIGQIAVELPGSTAVFRRLKLDFCCGGQIALQQACDNKGLDLDTVMAELARLDRPDGPAVPQAPAEMIDHILTRYHAVHREQLPELIRMARRVEAVHREHPDVPAGLAEHLEAIETEMLDHMAKEENILFPMLKAGGRGMALGMTAHAVGTSVALQESDECGAFAALAMSLMGVATAVFLPLAVSMVV